MIDLHCHILPGIDDGPKTIGDSLLLGRAAEAAGIQTIVATPHVNFEFPNDPATITRLLAEVAERFVAEGIGVELRPGAEIAMTMAGNLSRETISKLRLGGGPWMLLECPFTSLATGFDTLVLQLQGEGHRILLAHPERSPLFHRDPQLLASLAHNGVLMSITAGSIVGRFGGRVQRFARRLAQEELVHNVASDAHDHERRPPSVLSELEGSELHRLTEWLTQTVPAAILAGEEIPPRPASVTAPSGLGGWLRLRR